MQNDTRMLADADVRRIVREELQRAAPWLQHVAQSEVRREKDRAALRN